MSNKKKYWKNLSELSSEKVPSINDIKQREFVEEIPVDEFLGDKENLSNSSTSRRDFLKYLGFSTAAATLAACEGPVVKSIPYVVQPKEIVPGLANYYATTISNGYDFANILVKNREGRPIKIEHNKLAPSSSATNARVHASILDLYDSARLAQPMKNGLPTSWAQFDFETKSKLKEISDSSKSIVLLTQTFASPSTTKLIDDFKKQYSNVIHVIYDAISESAALDAFEKRYGQRGLANYDFSNADLIVSIGADFIGDWQGGGFESGYTTNRIPKNGKMSRHIQFESNMTLSGANSDTRISVKPSEQKLILLSIYSKLFSINNNINLSEKLQKTVDSTVSEILNSKSKAVLISGINDVNYQSLVLQINERIKSEAFNPNEIIKSRMGDASKVKELVQQMNSGGVGALIMTGVNPAYSLPNSQQFIEGLKEVDLSILFTMKNDETTSHVDYVATSSHYLESWGDAEIKKGEYSLIQPVINKLFDTRQFQDQLLIWSNSKKSYYQYVKDNWKKNILENSFWNKVLHDGVYSKKESNITKNKFLRSAPYKTFYTDLQDLIDRIPLNNNLYELTLYPKIGMGDGQQANNPWLQEFPDPLTRATWDNYLTISEFDAKKLDLYLEPSTFFKESSHDANGGLNGKYAIIGLNGNSIKVPVIIQPGQARGTVGLSFGYGRSSGVKDEMKTGVNAYKLYENFNAIQLVSIQATEGKHEFACIQLHNTLMGRGEIVKETSLEVFNTKDKKYWNAEAVVSLNHIETPVSSPKVDLWDEFDRSIGHHFNLSIDLNACTGCGACVIACNAENNVPVVGKREIRRSRDMHWLRIDRYYSSEDTFHQDDKKKDDISGLESSLNSFGELESPSENPQVAFQPIMCQHCNHAPCETVCPVAATSHGRQGQNHMAYNRCVGTRYCANNCPYKVRRFNWFLYNQNDEFDYHMNDDLGRMVLNPDVTVRSRGVMEKCSFCIQNTQAVILKAKLEGRPVAEGEFNDTCACASACSTGAMRFGDINEKDSEINKLKHDKRAYHLLDAVGTKPNVVYQVKIRNDKKV
jgi:molybdopterin-containing oxidoreductase family iron-sulfur binding subunit